MLLFILVFGPLVGLFIYGFFFANKRNGSTYHWSTSRLVQVWAASLTALALIPFIITAGVFIDKSADIRNSEYVVAQLVDQRDALAEVFEDVLDNEEFIRLTEASTPEDLLFLKRNSEVTEYMLGKADRLVAINSTLFAERNRLMNQSRSVCNYGDNPLAPKLPFLTPDCRLDELEELYR